MQRDGQGQAERQTDAQVEIQHLGSIRWSGMSNSDTKYIGARFVVAHHQPRRLI